MRLNDDHQYSTLTWVKPEIDETLRWSRQSIEAYLEDGRDPAALLRCADGLSQIHGALRMVELYGAAMVAEEMQALARAVHSGRVDGSDAVLAVLVRGIEVLPNYLDGLQSGFRDVPKVLLPLLNDLRAARGERGLAESMLFSPALAVPLPMEALGPALPTAPDVLRREAEAAGQRFQVALLRWLRDAHPIAAAELAGLCLDLVEITHAEPARRLFWIASALLDATARGVLPIDRSHQQALARVEREIRRLATEGDAAFRVQPPIELTRQLLYFCANASDRSGRLGLVATTFQLDAMLPSEQELEQIHRAMMGQKQAFASVAQAIKEDLLRVKDLLDMHLRSPAGVHEQLGDQIAVLVRVRETLGMLGLHVPKRVISDQLAVMQDLAGGQRPADEAVLLDLAGALLYVEARLDDDVAKANLPEAGFDPARRGAPMAGDARDAFEGLAREALDNFVRARACFVAFVETHWDHARLDPVAALLDEVSGALRMLEVNAAVEPLQGIARYTSEQLIELRRVPGGRELDHLADALAAAEYFLEALRDRRPHPEKILDAARQSLAALGYWPLPALPAAPAPAPALATAPEVLHEAVPPPQPAPVEEIAATPRAPAFGSRLPGFDDAASAEIDAEIQQVFLEEFAEEIIHLGRLLPVWERAPEQFDAIRPIRRVFHTLKGSGRLVGAKALGEFSWKIETLLNRVLDGSRPSTEPVRALVSQAVTVLPDLHAALAGEIRHGDLEGLIAVAEALAAGQELRYRPPVPEPVVEEPMPTEPVAEAEPEPESLPGEPLVEEPIAGELPCPAPSWTLLPEFEPEAQGLRFAIDPVLLEILKPEVEGHLEVVERWLDQAEAQGQRAVEESLLRSVHTMNGAFGMTEVGSITPVTGPLEGYCKRALAIGQSVDATELLLIRQASLAIRQTMRALAGAEVELPQFPALAAALAVLRDSLPEPGGPILALFEDLPKELAVEFTSAQAGTEGLSVELPPSSGIVAVDLSAHFDPPPMEAEEQQAQAMATDEPQSDDTPPEEEAAATAYAGQRQSLFEQSLADEEWERHRIAHDRAEREAEREAESQAEQEALRAAEAEQEALRAAEAERERSVAELRRREEWALRAQQQAALEAATKRPVGLRIDPSSVPEAGDPADPELPLDLTGIDTDLLAIFLDEAADLLDHSDGLMTRLRDGGADQEAVAGLQRNLHTLKGGARMAGVWPVGELGHAMESLLEAVAAGKREIDATGIVVLERCFDRLNAMVTRVADRKMILQPQGLIAQLQALAQGLPLSSATATADATADADRATTTPSTLPAETPRRPRPGGLSRPIENIQDEDEAGALRAAQEQVRIRADLLDKLVNYAGEVAIYRARLEQQLGSFRGNLNELEQTTARIRDQLRRLENETEAQIASRFQRDNEGETTFDPLELDRFSTQQQLTRSLAESTNDLGNLYDSLDELTRDYEALLLQQSRVSSDLQEGLMRTRMLPFESLVPRLRRVLRQACADTGKQAQLKIDGAGGEMDRNVLDRMTAPLEHMLRNAVAHGLEPPDARRHAGKEVEGVVRIVVAREGSEVVLRISDDGRGLDRDRIFAKAVERGLAAAEAQLSDEQVYGFILESGFSTADEVSRLSGRGVGMDVVSNEIRQLGGSLQIRSNASKGSEFTVRLPFTLAVTQAVFVRIGETRFAVPIASVQGVARINRTELEARRSEGGTPVFRYAGEEFILHDLGQLVGQAPAQAEGSLQMPLLLARSGDLRIAVCVDQVLGSREVVVKPVGPQVASVTGIFGATILGDGAVVVILDIAPLARRYLATASLASDRPVLPTSLPLAERRVPYVMVVDDSITMRKVTGRVLERHNFEVGTAKDGIDAIEKMAERVPDLMLLDIEMPRMDGYELAQTMRGDPRLREVPIIMITSRTGDKHRQRAFELGVNRYLGKPYQEPELIRNVYELLTEVSARG